LESIKAWFADLAADFRLNFIDGAMWKWLVEGLGHTLLITFFALLLGVVIGVVIAAIRSSYDKNREAMALHKGLGYYLATLLNGICKVYLTVIRGTPVMVQLLIMYFIIFGSSRSDILIATIAFGINSGAYVA
jgi:ABC-type amino acid transport system permease subunit